MLKRIAALLLLALLILMAPLLARALGPAKGTVPSTAMGGDQPGAWKDYNPAQAGAKGKRDQIPSGTLVVIAYILIWVVVLIYVLLLAMRQRRLVGELDQLRRRLDELEPPPDTGAEQNT